MDQMLLVSCNALGYLILRITTAGDIMLGACITTRDRRCQWSGLTSIRAQMLITIVR